MVFLETKREKLVYTIPDRCRVCFTCIRECPAKAIRMENGQAAVIHERCIACGNCVKVCSQGAKDYLREKDIVAHWLSKNEPVIALVAPSFPAEFTEVSEYSQFIGALREMGFHKVVEVGFGADLVAKKLRELMNEDGKSLISSDCPAIVQYIEHYHPDLIDHLAPVVSPMVASARVVDQKFGKTYKKVFIGPCIGKKAESDEIDAGITFSELREMLQDLKISIEKMAGSEFDPPLAGKGGIFPVKRGLLQTLDIPENLFEGQIVVGEGKANFTEAIAEFENGSIADQHMALLCCEGCIMGPGMSKRDKRFLRRSKVGSYMQAKMAKHDNTLWNQDMDHFSDICLDRSFFPADRRLEMPDEEKVKNILLNMGKRAESDHLNCGACGYESCRSHAIAISQGLAETEMCLPLVIEKLASAQKALRQSEKLAHMGQLSAGIAHELNNPLGVVMMYANLLLDENMEGPLKKDLELIVNQADRCKKIVGNLLNFARKNQVRKEAMDIDELLRECKEAILVPDNVNVHFKRNKSSIFVELDREQIMQVLTNLCRNGVEAMIEGGELFIEAERKSKEVVIYIRDTGSGISQENMDKLFTPFFTTKEFGKGTGLGLATSYGIIKMHQGRIEVVSNDQANKGLTGTCFKIYLPINE